MAVSSQQGILKRHRLKAGNERPLTMKQQLFIDYYLQTQNGVESAKRAGYKGSINVLNQQAMDNLQHPTIARRVAQRLAPVLKRAKMSADQVLEQLSDIAGAEWRDFLQIRYGKDGEIIDAQLKLGDKVKALEIMAKYHGLLQADRTNDGRRAVYLETFEWFVNFRGENNDKEPMSRENCLKCLERQHPDARTVCPELWDDEAQG